MIYRFGRDLRRRTAAHIIPIHCTSKQALKSASKPGTSISRSPTPRKKSQGLPHNEPIKPTWSNPKGRRPTLRAKKSVHLICNEIYSWTVFNPSPPFASIAEIIPKSKNTNPRSIHTVYSLSKDLGVPGFRVGTICSQNDEILSTSRRMSSFSLISSQTQAILTRMLLDIEFMSRYMVTSKKRLREA
ncbi:hypothetical protein AMTR_s00111p00124110 [Amborella trichopoda]|uniref:Aminotransferase class I/classII large domain-containing protein n=1 Tax=Amborella trichopoda TaxID=13333 RepID=W1NSX3_AMBTC|nr:hypothetical protein AMTR_s00111p00124110 [Amborella trichopoda]